MVDHLGLSTWLKQITSNALVGGDHPDKAASLAALLKQGNLEPHEAVMVGDRDSDIAAGKANHLATLGALWGYGSADELRLAGADALCASPKDIGIWLDHQAP